MNLRFRLFIEWAIIAALSCAAILLALRWEGTASFDNLFYDQLSSISRPEADDNILIVAIDDPSLDELGIWPWPRRHHAALIADLKKAQPRSILLDVLVSEPGDDDGQLADAIGDDARVFLPVHFPTPGSNGAAYDTVLPVAPLSAKAAGLGHVNIEFDSDGRVRRVALCFQPEKKGKRWPHIVELVARKGGKSTAAYQRQQDCEKTLLLPYAPRGSFATVSFAGAMNGGLPADLVRGRDIIIGATATGMGDSYPAPYGDGGLLSGAEIMANMLSALKKDTFITPAPIWLMMILSVLPTFLLLLGFLRLRPRSALIASIGAVVVVLLGSAVALGFRFWMAPGAALIGIFLVYPLWGWRRLQAMSDFMVAELGDLEHEGAVLPALPARSSPDDMVGRQSEQLAGAIDQLRDLRRFVTDAIEDMPDPLVVTDLDGRITLTNDNVRERLGTDVNGRSLNSVLDRAVLPAHRKQVGQYLERATDNSSQTDAETDAPFVRFNDNQNQSFVLRTADVRTDAGELRGHIHYFTDITDLSRAEADREVALQLLSHDMRAPQSAIIALLPEIANKRAGERIERHARRTMQLAQDFVDIARMGESAFEGSDILMADLVRDVADNFWPLAKEKKINIEVEDQSEEAFVFAEPDSLSRALSNLIDNAIKYSPDGSTISVTISRHPVDSGAMIVTSIDDQGSGIAPEIAERLFERFASRRSGERVKGIGLGLAFVRAVAERHGGTVSAENRPEGGARFVFTLPEAPEPDEGPAEAF